MQPDQKLQPLRLARSGRFGARLADPRGARQTPAPQLSSGAGAIAVHHTPGSNGSLAAILRPDAHAFLERQYEDL
jgi:hypothetical protein